MLALDKKIFKFHRDFDTLYAYYLSKYSPKNSSRALKNVNVPMDFIKCEIQLFTLKLINKHKLAKIELFPSYQ